MQFLQLYPTVFLIILRKSLIHSQFLRKYQTDFLLIMGFRLILLLFSQKYQTFRHRLALTWSDTFSIFAKVSDFSTSHGTSLVWYFFSFCKNIRLFDITWLNYGMILFRFSQKYQTLEKSRVCSINI